MHLVLNRA